MGETLQLSPAFVRSALRGDIRLPWWAYRSTKPDQTSDLYFQFEAPRRLLVVPLDERPRPETFARSNDLYRRLQGMRDSSELVGGLAWRGERLGPRGLFLLNTAIQRGLLTVFKNKHPGAALTKRGFGDLLAWLEIWPVPVGAKANR